MASPRQQTFRVVLLQFVILLKKKKRKKKQERSGRDGEEPEDDVTLCDTFEHKRYADRPAMYCRLDATVPVLRMWFDGESDIRTDFRLTRAAMISLQRLLHQYQDHGWGNELEIVHRVADSIFSNLRKAISLPGLKDLPAVGQGFVALSGTPAFNNVVGAIDGSHIRIKPPAPHRLDYLNYKGFYSINMQAICDADGRFLDIFVGYPGSVHDTRVMKNSPFYRKACYPPPGHIILGDGGYPCLQTPISLITPYKEPVRGVMQQRFNYHHAKAKNIIERVFGIMKTLEVAPAFATKVICSCAFLHNVCLENGDSKREPDVDIIDGFDPPPPPQDPQPEASGNVLRDTLAARVSEGVTM
ncbi:hypothetical protein ACEWY4_022602 [Coilia grayii]|uniref:Putative nuclease HARBI1 n=1 Tax=Coilia grayii TaxID=363190 RepID=A0ABD1J6T8_9TELE